MFERFTDRARRVMALANQEAQRLRHEYIGTEHILAGLVKEGTGVGARVLTNLGVDLRKIRGEIEKLVGPGSDVATIDKLPHTPRAKDVFEYAIEEARSLGHNYVGTEHLLLGILRERDGVAGQVLTNFGLELPDVRDEVINLLESGVESETTPARVPGQAPLPVRLDQMATESRIRLAIECVLSAKDAAVQASDYERAAELRDAAEHLRNMLSEPK